ncbi:hypothetical protein ACHAPU_007112 [Fusarium lateritium]
MSQRKNNNSNRQVSIPSGHDISARLAAMSIGQSGVLPSRGTSEARQVTRPIVASSAESNAAQKRDDEIFEEKTNERKARKECLPGHGASDQETLLSQLPNDPPETFAIPTHIHKDSGQELSNTHIRARRRIRAMQRNKAAKKRRVAEEKNRRQYAALNADGSDDEANNASKNAAKGKKPFDIGGYLPERMR